MERIVEIIMFCIIGDGFRLQLIERVIGIGAWLILAGLLQKVSDGVVTFHDFFKMVRENGRGLI